LGYTHYWYRPLVLEQDLFTAWSEDVQKIVDTAGVPIAGGCGTGDPELTNTYVWINGKLDDGLETFGVEQNIDPVIWMDSKDEKSGLYHDYCKTGKYPYDIVVTTALIRLKKYFPVVEFSDNDDGTVEEWRPAVELYEKLFGEKVPFDGILPWIAPIEKKKTA